MELSYVRQYACGRLPAVPLPIGVFSSTAEATLAVELHEAALAGEPVPGVPVAKGGVTRVGIMYGHVRPSRHLMTAAGYRRARVKAFRIWRQETCVQIGT